MSKVAADDRYPLDLGSLPHGWADATVGEVTDGIRPGFASGEHNRDTNGVPHLRPMNIDRAGRIDLSDVKYVAGHNPLRLSMGDVLFNNTNSPELVGKTAPIYSSDELAYSNHMTRLRPTEGMSCRFMALQLHYLWFFTDFRGDEASNGSAAYLEVGQRLQGAGGCRWTGTSLVGCSAAGKVTCWERSAAPCLLR